jgi:DNA-binding NtrC family response regulator
MKKVLVYSENEKFREEIKVILEDKRELILTESYEQALDVIKHAPIEVIITDQEPEDENIDGIKVIVINKYDEKKKVLSMFK